MALHAGQYEWSIIARYLWVPTWNGQLEDEEPRVGRSVGVDVVVEVAAHEIVEDFHC